MKLYVNIMPDPMVMPKTRAVIQFSVIAGGSNNTTDSPDDARMVTSSDSVSAECQRTKGSRRIW